MKRLNFCDPIMLTFQAVLIHELHFCFLLTSPYLITNADFSLRLSSHSLVKAAVSVRTCEAV